MSGQRTGINGYIVPSNRPHRDEFMNQLDTDFLKISIASVSQELRAALHTGQRLTDIESASDGCAGIMFQCNGEIDQYREAVEVCDQDAITITG